MGVGGLSPKYNCSFNFKFLQQFPVIIQYGGSRTRKVKLLLNLSKINPEYKVSIVQISYW